MIQSSKRPRSEPSVVTLASEAILEFGQWQNRMREETSLAVGEIAEAMLQWDVAHIWGEAHGRVIDMSEQRDLLDDITTVDRQERGGAARAIADEGVARTKSLVSMIAGNQAVEDAAFLSAAHRIDPEEAQTLGQFIELRDKITPHYLDPKRPKRPRMSRKIKPQGSAASTPHFADFPSSSFSPTSQDFPFSLSSPISSSSSFSVSQSSFPVQAKSSSRPKVGRGMIGPSELGPSELGPPKREVSQGATNMAANLKGGSGLARMTAHCKVGQSELEPLIAQQLEIFMEGKHNESGSDVSNAEFQQGEMLLEIQMQKAVQEQAFERCIELRETKKQMAALWQRLRSASSDQELRTYSVQLRAAMQTL